MMNETGKFYKFFCVLVLAAISISFNPSVVQAEDVDPFILDQRVIELKNLIKEGETKGVDVSRAMELSRRSLEAMRNGKPQETLSLLEKAIELMRQSDEAGNSRALRQPERESPPSLKKKTVELPVGSVKVLITEVVPSYNSGKNIENKDYSSIFDTKMLESTTGKVALQISSIPVIVEEVDSISTASTDSGQMDSPFAIHDIQPHELKYLDDLGVRLVRYSAINGIVWDFIEPKKGKFNWSRNDDLYLKTYKNNVSMLVEIIPVSSWDQAVKGKLPAHKLPENLKACKEFIEKVVERYDGDGIDDAPGSPVIEYWLIENEPDFLWEDDPKKFAELVKISYKAIKHNNKKAKVVMAGVATPEGFQNFYIPMLKHLDKIKDKPGDKYFDIFEFHWWMGGTGGYLEMFFKGRRTDMEEYIESIRKELKKYDYNVPIWITEMASHSGSPKQRWFNLSHETERQQAAELFKRYIYPRSLGIKKIFWSTITEWHNFMGIANGYFDTIGLINNPKNDGESHKKLAYYTYKLMTEKLKGVDWERMELIELGKDVFGYRLPKNGKSVYVLWAEQ